MVWGKDSDAIRAAMDAVAAAGEAPARWPEALAAIAACTGDVGAILFYRRPDGAFSAVVTPNLTETLEDFSRSAWSDNDFRFERASERGFLQRSQCVTDRDVASEQEIETHPYYAFLREHGLAYFAGLNVSPLPTFPAALSVQRAVGRPPFDAEELEIVAAFGPPIRAALDTNARAAAGLRAQEAGAVRSGWELDRETAVLLSQLANSR